MSLKLEDVQMALQNNGVAATVVTKVLEELKEAQEENKTDTTNKKKNQYIVVLKGDNTLHAKIQTAWICQSKEDFDPTKLPTAIDNAKVATNNSMKRKKNLLNGLADIFARAKAKFCKLEGFSIKTKQPVNVVWFE